MKPKILAIVVAALLLVGGGAFALTRFMAPSTDDALAFVPPDAYFYANFFINPSNSQKQALDDFLRKFPGIESTDDAIEKLTNLLDDSLEEEGLSYEEDVQPWLGDQLAVFGVPGASPDAPNGAVMVESKDDDAAREFLEKVDEGVTDDLEAKTYKDTEYEAGEDFALAFLEGFMVAGTEDAIKRSIDTLSGDETLETSEKFTAATDPLEDDWIGLFYLDPAALFDEFSPAAGMTPEDLAAFEAFGFEDQKPQASILYVTPDAAVFEGSGSLTGTGPFSFLASTTEPGLVPELPADSWLALGFPQLGELAEGVLDVFAGIPGFDRAQIDAMFYAQTGLRLEEDILSWMGDFAVFAQGSNFQDVGSGIVVESTDPAKTAALVEKARALIVQQGIRPTPASLGGLDGFALQVPGVPAPVYFLGGERLVIAYGEDAAEAAAGGGETLADSEAFTAAQEAVGDDFNISFFLDVDAAQAFGEAVAGFTGALDETYEQDAKPIVDVFTHVVSASKKEGDTIVSKILVGVE